MWVIACDQVRVDPRLGYVGFAAGLIELSGLRFRAEASAERVLTYCAMTRQLWS